MFTTLENVITTIKNFVISNKINYACIASSQNKFVLPDLLIAVNLSKCEKALCFLYKDIKAPHSSFYKDKWFLNSGVSIYFTLFESDFVDMTSDNYDWVETTNSKALLYMVASSTILITYEIINSEKGTTKVIVSKL